MVRKDTVCHMRTINIKIRLQAYKIRIHTSLNSYMCVCVHKSDASDTQAKSGLPSRP